MSHGADCPDCGQCNCECAEIEQSKKILNKLSKLRDIDLTHLKMNLTSDLAALEKQTMNRSGFKALDSLKKELSALLGELR